MVSVKLPFLDVRRDRHGRAIYYYFRRNGSLWPLPGKPGSEEWTAEYNRLLVVTAPKPAADPPIDKRHYPRGTFGALINDFLESGQFKTKKPRTKGEYKRICELLQADHGTKRVAHLERRHVRIIRDAKADTPGEANNVLRMVKIVLNFAVDDGLIKASPAAKFKELPIGEWRAWTDEECSRYEKRWAPGTMQRRAYALALYTGQRLTDLVTRTRAHRTAGCIYVVQSKTDEELLIPEHRELTAELARGVAGTDTLLFTPTQGKHFDQVYFGAWMADAIDKAGLPDDCVLHGLRKTAARKLADMGQSTETIKSITGHVTGRMVEKYVKGANQKRLAKEAIRRWENEG